MNFELDTSDFFAHLDTKERKVVQAAKEGVEDALDDLEYISSNIAPIDSSQLRKSSQKQVKEVNGGIAGELTFSAIEKSGEKRFNYALWIHEEDYNLGTRSQAAGGTNGYEVGNKYIERPLKGEAERYVKNWSEKIAKEMDAK